MTDSRRAIPPVNAVLERDGVRELLERLPRPLVTDAVRSVLDEVRRGANGGEDPIDWTKLVEQEVARRTQPSLRRAINATGVILHTNLGRAPLAESALDAVRDVAGGYSSLEYDIDAGARGSRQTHCRELLCELTGAEDALVVNNCASALVLALDTLAGGREAIVSRGELVEIGGSFRVPDIMRKSGATLIEVGTTNRTHLADYERAISARTGAVVKVHRSNFEMAGFVAEVPLRDVCTLAREREVPVIHDAGSGLMISLSDLGLGDEPTLRDSVIAGADVTVSSGDKLLGGPQAGIALGSAAAIGAMAKNPLARAMRVDKMTLAALWATLRLYRDPPTARREVPILAMITASESEVRSRAERLRGELARAGVGCAVVQSEASVGGGALPNAKIPSWALSFEQPAGLEPALRGGDPPVIGRVLDDRLLLDVRTVLPADEAQLIRALLAVLA